MTKKSGKINQVTGAGTWDSPYGTMYRYEITMDNGDVGQALTKKEQQETYVIGDTIDYEFTDGKFPKIKRVFEEQQTFQKKSVNQDIIVRQVAFKGAIDLVSNNGGDINKVMDLTDVFNKFILTGERPQVSEEMPF